MSYKKSTIEFNKNKYELRLKLSIYKIEILKVLKKNKYILINFTKGEKDIVYFYHLKTFKNEITFISEKMIKKIHELSNGYLIFFFSECFKIYNISNKQLVEIQKIIFLTQSKIETGSMNLVELSSTDFLYNQSNKTIYFESHSKSEKEEKKENPLTKIYILDTNKKQYYEKEERTFPPGKIVKFRENFAIIQKKKDRRISSTYAHYYIYLFIEGSLKYLDKFDTHSEFSECQVKNDNLFLSSGNFIYKYYIDNNFKSIKTIFDFKHNPIYLTLFNEKDNLLHLILDGENNRTLYHNKYDTDFKLIEKEKIDFYVRYYRSLEHINEKLIILQDSRNSFSSTSSSRYALYFYENINKKNIILTNVSDNEKIDNEIDEGKNEINFPKISITQRK